MSTATPSIDDLPDWVPDHLRRYATVTGDRTLRINTSPPGRVQDLAFDRTGDGWRIEIDQPGVAGNTVEVAEPGTKVHWVLTRVGGQPIRLGRGLRRVDVDSTAGQQVRLLLEDGTTNLHLCPSGYRIDGDQASYHAWLHGDADSAYTLTGSATLTYLKGPGTVTIDGSVAIEHLAFTGSLTVTGTLEARVVEITDGTLTCGALTADRLTARAVTVRGDLQLADRLDADTVRVRGRLDGTTDSAEFAIADQLTATAMARIRVRATGPQLAKIGVGTIGEGCELVGQIGEASIEVAEAGLILDATAAALTISGNSGGALELAADTIAIRSVTGTGTLNCRTLTVRSDLLGDDEAGLTVVASDGIEVRGTVQNATLTSRGTVTVGTGASSAPTAGDPVVTAGESVQLAPIGWGGPAGGDAVIDCVIMTDGDLQVTRPVERSLLHAGGRLLLAQSIDNTEVDAGRLLRRLPPADRTALGEEAETRVCSGSTVLVNGSIQLSPVQQAHATSLFSAKRVDGGAIMVPQGTFVAEQVQDSDVRADALGIHDQLGGATKLDAESLMVLNAAPAEETRLVLRGSGHFTEPVDTVLEWSPAPGSDCDVSAGSADLRITAPAGLLPVAAPTLILGRTDHPNRYVTLSGTVRVTVQEPEGPDRSKGAATRLWDKIRLDQQARLHVAAPRVDVGVVHVETDRATVIREGSHPGSVIRLAPTTPGRHLDLTPGRGLQLSLRDDISPPEDNAEHDAEDLVVPAIRLAGGDLHIETELGTVECHADDGGPPVLSLTVDGAIGDLSGRFHLAGLQGRITTSRPRSGRFRSLWGRLTDYKWTDRPYPPPDRPASLERILDNEQALAGGELIGVAVTDLPYTDIARLEELHVFGPDGVSLMEAASDRSAARPHERAQRLRRLVDVVGANANSGATRSAVMWAAACAQHQAIDTYHWIERAARRLFRVVGYGYRPAPAFLTYVLWVVGLAVVLRVVDDGSRCGADGEFTTGPYSLGEQLLRVVLLPIATFRVDLGGAPAYAPVCCSAGWHALCSGVSLLVLAFLVVAIRNYMRTPKS